jgi:methylenetetrahydrofolate dehydrogenase (NADP+)/methenyltetrahydrofolate cyclohydrolase
MAELSQRAKAVRNGGVNLRLVSVQVGENPGAEAYARQQGRACAQIGAQHRVAQLPADISQRELEATLRELNDDPGTTGVLLQLPLPQHLDARELQQKISPEKDVEGVNAVNLARVMLGRPVAEPPGKPARLLAGKAGLAPCTAAAVLELLAETGLELRGAEVVMVGHSEIVGKPTALLLLDRLATVTVCHIGTRDLAAHTRRGEILIVAAGVPGLVKGDMIRPGAAVIDVGINLVGGEIVGDIDFESASQVAAWITPVPGGVGPVTVAVLMRNLVLAAERQVSPT